MTAALANTELDLLNRDLAGATAKQERLATILAEGVARFRGESEHLANELAESKTRAAALESTQADNIRLSKKVSVLTQERDALNELYQRTHGDLVAAHGDIERYLARISGTQLQGLLAEDTNAAALIPLTLGQPVSMGGDFLVTLTVSQPPTGKIATNAPATVMIKLVVQRPAAAANPDATVVLYDAKRRPLRRIATSFPHVDQGAPFVTLGASLTCDRTPAFARIILAPGLDDVAAK
jgi:chromosome segregation ATPase